MFPFDPPETIGKLGGLLIFSGELKGNIEKKGVNKR